MSARRATPDDLLSITSFICHVFGQEHFPDHAQPPAQDKVFACVAACLRNGCVFVVERDDGAIIGSIGGIISTPWWSYAPAVYEQWYFVARPHRATRSAQILLRALRDFATENSLKLICSVATGEDVERKDKFFARSGFRRIGGTYESKT